MKSGHRFLGGLFLAVGAAGLLLYAFGDGPTRDTYRLVFGGFDVIGGLLLLRAPKGQAGVPAALPPREAGPEIEELVRNGEVIAAIKQYRATYGAGLKDAKDAIDAIRARLRGDRP